MKCACCMNVADPTKSLNWESDRAVWLSLSPDWDSVTQHSKTLSSSFWSDLPHSSSLFALIENTKKKALLSFSLIDRSRAVSGQLSIILHCVQKFLIIVVDVCPDLEVNDRRRLAICSRGLLRQCEDAKYAPINECLSRTRTFYIQVWCALLCVPFAVD